MLGLSRAKIRETLVMQFNADQEFSDDGLSIKDDLTPIYYSEGGLFVGIQIV